MEISSLPEAKAQRVNALLTFIRADLAHKL